MLEFRQVVKSYGSGVTEVRAVTDVDLSFPAGQFCAVMGPSGCGKSTLLHLAGALEAPNAGRVLVNGTDVSSMSAVVQAELRTQSHAHLGWHIGVVGQVLERIARCQRQHGEQHQADAQQAGQRNQQAADDVVGQRGECRWVRVGNVWQRAAS